MHDHALLAAEFPRLPEIFRGDFPRKQLREEFLFILSDNLLLHN